MDSPSSVVANALVASDTDQLFSSFWHYLLFFPSLTGQLVLCADLSLDGLSTVDSFSSESPNQ